MGQVGPRVPARPERGPETPDPTQPRVTPLLVEPEDLPHCRVALEQCRGGRGRHHVHGPVPLRERGEERGREDDVAEEGGLDDEDRVPLTRRHSTCSTARNASCGISTAPICFMRFFPSFCFSRSLRLRVMSPP